ncbi:MAG: TonB-dependent receptor plug domain-containing protein, partial [Gammaproteobacteria bacterium]|nr:TonB-dependent receptor plug domain-containing protein [Gammaproteobacteria bacterium]
MRTFLSLLFVPARCVLGRAIRTASVPRVLAVLAAASCIAIAPASLAQDEEDEEDQPGVVAADDDDIEEVVVTGSRLKRDTYTSVAPLQIITGEVSREAGVIDAEEIVQKSTVSAGAQIDVTFAGFVLDDGPGTQTANLRGLGSNRTLLLVNGRRMGAAGVEGAPTSPDLGLIPGSLVQQYDLLLDGASSVYGSDAIAGVANVILRKDFNGLEVETFPSRPYHEGGDQDVLALTWGKNFDRGFIGIGAEYNSSDPVTYADRPWTAGCSRNIEIDEGGRTRTEPLYYPTVYGMDMEGCGSIFPLSSRIAVPLRGSVYYTAGYSNGGWPNFSESESWGFPIDNNGDGEPDVNYRDHSLNGRRDYAELYPTFKSQNYMVFGEYTLEGEMNLTPFFELGYVENDIALIGDEAQIFQEVPARNPFNICNPEGRGVDCGLASDALLLNPNFMEKFNVRWAGLCAAFGIPNSICAPVLYNAFGLTVGPMGPQPTTPIVTIRGDRSDYVRYLEQFRYVAGVSGDLPMLDFWQLSDWSFEFAYVHSRSDGTVRRAGIREDRLLLSLGAYSINDIP